MRPRVFPAEDEGHDPADARNAGRFNEAAGIPRGRLLLASTMKGGVGLLQ